MIEHINRSTITVLYIVGAYDPQLRFIKIGITGNMDKRLASLQNASPLRLRVIETKYYRGIGLSTYEIEKKLHRYLQEYRVRGEWFLPEALHKIPEFDAMLEERGRTFKFDFRKALGLS
jgi:hypothetical protein